MTPIWPLLSPKYFQSTANDELITSTSAAASSLETFPFWTACRSSWKAITSFRITPGARAAARTLPIKSYVPSCNFAMPPQSGHVSAQLTIVTFVEFSILNARDVNTNPHASHLAGTDKIRPLMPLRNMCHSASICQSKQGTKKAPCRHGAFSIHLRGGADQAASISSVSAPCTGPESWPLASTSRSTNSMMATGTMSDRRRPALMMRV